MSHYRVNFIPINFGVIALLVMLALGGIGASVDALNNGKQPRPAPVSEILAHTNMRRNYVAAQGAFFPDSGFQEIEKSSNHTENRYDPLVDIEGRRAILVKRADDSPLDPSRPTKATVVGMLTSLPADLRKHIEEEGGKIDDVALDTEYMLAEGAKPGSAALLVPATLLCLVVCAAFIVTLLMKYVVFQKTGDNAMGLAAAPAMPEQGISLRVTGRMAMDARNAKRFLNVPSVIAKLDTGEVALVSNIDASSRFMGVTTQKRAGLWAIVLQPNSLNKFDKGILYDGLKGYPALRLHYKEAGTNAQAKAILSFNTDTEREIAIGELNQLARFDLSRA